MYDGLHPEAALYVSDRLVADGARQAIAWLRPWTINGRLEVYDVSFEGVTDAAVIVRGAVRWTNDRLEQRDEAFTWLVEFRDALLWRVRSLPPSAPARAALAGEADRLLDPLPVADEPSHVRDR